MRLEFKRQPNSMKYEWCASYHNGEFEIEAWGSDAMDAMARLVGSMGRRLADLEQRG